MANFTSTYLSRVLQEVYKVSQAFEVHITPMKVEMVGQPGQPVQITPLNVEVVNQPVHITTVKEKMVSQAAYITPVKEEVLS